MQGLDRRSTRLRLGLGLGLVALSSLAAAANGQDPACMMGAADALPTASPESSVLQLLESGSGNSGNLELVCDGDRLASLRLKLVPGQTRSIVLVTRPGVNVPMQATENSAASEDGQSGVWQLSLKPAEPTEHGPTAQLIEVVVTAHASNRLGQQQSFQLFGSERLPEGPQNLSVELVLESLDGERMFRDNFKVDPSVGQFSQRADRPGSLENRMDPNLGSTTL